MVARDQMVGPWQVPVADVAVTIADYEGNAGEAMALGERTPLALLDAPASGRMAIGEAITNLMAAPVESMGKIKLSANWMAAAGYQDEDARLFDTVKAVGMELCPRLGIAIPVGKDSMSMKTVWRQNDETREMAAPLSLIITAFAPVTDVRNVLTPALRMDQGDTDLILIDLGKGLNRLGASALGQVYEQLGHVGPDLDDPEMLRRCFDVFQELNRDGLILASHDRSDGGLMVTLLEMAFAGRCGLDIGIDALDADALAALFSEELGLVLQVRHSDCDDVLKCLEDAGLGHYSHVLGTTREDEKIVIFQGNRVLLERQRSDLQQIWSETSLQMQLLRDHPECAREEFRGITADDPGLSARLSFDPEDDIAAPLLEVSRPRIAILREQGVNGQREMAYRTGINIAMYALTGNYKADQVHTPALLERIGQ